MNVEGTESVEGSQMISEGKGGTIDVRMQFAQGNQINDSMSTNRIQKHKSGEIPELSLAFYAISDKRPLLSD